MATDADSLRTPAECYVNMPAGIHILGDVMKNLALLIAGAASLAIPAAASAAVITQSIAVTGSNFALQLGSGSVLPIDPAYISFAVTLDNSLDILSTTSGLSVSSTNLPYVFSYSYDSGADALVLSSGANNPGACYNPASSACLFIDQFSTTPNVAFFGQTTSVEGSWQARTIRQGAPGVPEPATWAMMILGMGAIGFAMRRRHGAKVRFAF